MWWDMNILYIFYYISNQNYIFKNKTIYIYVYKVRILTI